MDLLLCNNMLVSCSQLLIQNSALLQDLSLYCESDKDPIPVPDFISKTIICDLNYLLTTNDFEYVNTCDCVYIVEIIRSADFLLIDVIVSPLQAVLEKKLSHATAFKVFQHAMKLQCLETVVQKCVEMIIRVLENYNHFFFHLFYYRFHVQMNHKNYSKIEFSSISL